MEVKVRDKFNWDMRSTLKVQANGILKQLELARPGNRAVWRDGRKVPDGLQRAAEENYSIEIELSELISRLLPCLWCFFDWSCLSINASFSVLLLSWSPIPGSDSP